LVKRLRAGAGVIKKFGKKNLGGDNLILIRASKQSLNSQQEWNAETKKADDYSSGKGGITSFWIPKKLTGNRMSKNGLIKVDESAKRRGVVGTRLQGFTKKSLILASTGPTLEWAASVVL